MKNEDKKKYGIYAGPPLRQLLDERAGGSHTPTAVVNTVADRYLEIVRRAVPALTRTEWALVLEALRRRQPARATAAALATLWDEIDDDLAAAIHAAGSRSGGAGAPEPTRATAASLTTRLRRLSYPETVAVADVAERFWRRFDPAHSLFILPDAAFTDALAALDARRSP